MHASAAAVVCRGPGGTTLLYVCIYTYYISRAPKTSLGQSCIKVKDTDLDQEYRLLIVYIYFYFKYDVFPAKKTNIYIYQYVFIRKYLCNIISQFFLVSFKNLLDSLSLFSLYFSDGEGRKL